MKPSSKITLPKNQNSLQRERSAIATVFYMGMSGGGGAIIGYSSSYLPWHGPGGGLPCPTHRLRERLRDPAGGDLLGERLSERERPPPPPPPPRRGLNERLLDRDRDRLRERRPREPDRDRSLRAAPVGITPSPTLLYTSPAKEPAPIYRVNFFFSSNFASLSRGRATYNNPRRNFFFFFKSLIVC